jgi:hypothetical protein
MAISQLGKLVALMGVLLLVGGGLLMLAGRFGMTRLPGDLVFAGRHWKVYFPLASSILVSLVLTLLLNLLLRLFR